MTATDAVLLLKGQCVITDGSIDKPLKVFAVKAPRYLPISEGNFRARNECGIRDIHAPIVAVTLFRGALRFTR